MKKTFVVLLAGVLILGFATLSEAELDSKGVSMNVSAMVPSYLSVTANPLEFGDLHQTNPTTAQTNIIVNISASISSYTIAINAGEHFSTTVNSRRLAGTATPVNYINYELYRADGTTLWGDGGATHPGAVFTHDPEGTTPVPAGTYSHAVFGRAQGYGSASSYGSYGDVVHVRVVAY